MRLQQQLRDRFRDRFDRGTVYECALCGLRFDDERQDCPACGYIVREAK